MHFVVQLACMADKNSHNQRFRSIMVGYFADWHQIERIWTSARKAVASRAATAALDDFLQEHDTPTTDKSKE